jgi:hypothetical protein
MDISLFCKSTPLPAYKHKLWLTLQYAQLHTFRRHPLHTAFLSYLHLPGICLSLQHNIEGESLTIQHVTTHRPISQQHVPFPPPPHYVHNAKVNYVHTGVRGVENWTCSLLTFYISFRTLNSPALSSIPFQAYMLLNDALRTMFYAISHEYYAQIVCLKPPPLYTVLRFIYSHQNIISTHRIATMDWKERMFARSWPTT